MKEEYQERTEQDGVLHAFSIVWPERKEWTVVNKGKLMKLHIPLKMGRQLIIDREEKHIFSSDAVKGK